MPLWQLFHDAAAGGKTCRRMIRMAPLMTGDVLWGALCLETCDQVANREGIELDSLRAVAHMLGAAIVRRQAQDALIEANDMLERRVAERTRALNEEVIAKETARQKLEEVQQRMVDLSRRAGMAEVATGVLHNVGNVLNSLNVASTLVRERVQQSRLDKLAAVVDMLRKQQDNLDDFLRTDAKGVHLLPYLSKLSAYLLEERNQMAVELTNMGRHVGHIKEVVAAQQGYASTAGFMQTLKIQRVVADALSLAHEGMQRHGIIVKAEVPEEMEIHTDKHKVLQIILNLLQNAKDALKQADGKEKQITIHAQHLNDGRVQVSVADNGIGISQDMMGKIFRHGFTTKPTGHGFGLHSGAITARELGGQITAESAGVGMGARFCLELPGTPPDATSPQTHQGELPALHSSG
jgi:two-component system, NtrC family, sensor kinase